MPRIRGAGSRAHLHAGQLVLIALVTAEVEGNRRSAVAIVPADRASAQIGQRIRRVQGHALGRSGTMRTLLQRRRLSTITPRQPSKAPRSTEPGRGLGPGYDHRGAARWHRRRRRENRCVSDALWPNRIPCLVDTAKVPLFAKAESLGLGSVPLIVKS